MKAIIVIDGIKNCDDYYAEVTIKNKNSYKKVKTIAHIDLKPIPDKIDIGYPCDTYDEGYSHGWDECIDEILGETE